MKRLTSGIKSSVVIVVICSNEREWHTFAFACLLHLSVPLWGSSVKVYSYKDLPIGFMRSMII